MKILLAFMLVMCIFLSFTSCKSLKQIQYIEKEVPIEKIKIEYRDKVKIDSIYINERDSSDTRAIGDSIIKFKYIEKKIEKYLYVHDTITKKDTVNIPVTVKEKEIQYIEKDKGLAYWQIILMCIGAFSIIVCIYRIVTKLKIR